MARRATVAFAARATWPCWAAARPPLPAHEGLVMATYASTQALLAG